jgi:predicted permease
MAVCMEYVLILVVGILSPEATKANAGLILNMLLPMLTFASVVSSFDPSNMQSFAALLITGVTYMTMGFLFGFLVRTLTPVPRTWRGGVLIAGALFVEMLSLGKKIGVDSRF